MWVTLYGYARILRSLVVSEVQWYTPVRDSTAIFWLSTHELHEQ